MKISDKGLRFIINVQMALGAKNIIYTDIQGTKRIGYGHPVRMGEQAKYVYGLTKAQADKFLQDDLIVVAADLEQACFNLKIKQHQFDAIGSLMLCLSPTEWNKSIVKNALLRRDLLSVPDGFLEWVHVAEDGKLRKRQVLVKLRNAERELFEKGIYEKPE